jgi:hypothetical protein
VQQLNLDKETVPRYEQDLLSGFFESGRRRRLPHIEQSQEQPSDCRYIHFIALSAVVVMLYEQRLGR